MRKTYLRISLSILLLDATGKLLAQQQAPALPPTIAAPDAPPGPVRSIERWDKPALGENELYAYPPLFGETDDFPEFTRELLRVQWRSGDPIDLYIVRPVGVARPPVILYLYGYPGEAVRFLNNSLCKTVTAKGYAAVGFSSMMTGQRYHDVPMKEWFVSNLQQSLAGTAHDVQMVLNYLTARDDFDMGRVGIFGEGSGGTIALLAASVDTRLKAVDVLNPWGDWPTWLADSAVVPRSERETYRLPSFLGAVRPFDPVNLLPGLTRLPVRVQQNLWDNSRTPIVARQKIAGALPPNADLVQYKDQQEYYQRAGSNGKMLDWMYAHLPAK